MTINDTQVILTENDLNLGTNLYANFTNLRNIHQTVVNNYPDKELVYPKETTITVSIPNNGQSIPLPQKVDFNNSIITIQSSMSGSDNNPFYLFSLSQGAIEFKNRVSKRDIDSGEFAHIPELNSGLKLLRIEDERIWAMRNEGDIHASFHRQDILLIKDGHALNKPIYPYNDPQSYPTTKYCTVDDEQKHIKI